MLVTNDMNLRIGQFGLAIGVGNGLARYSIDGNDPSLILDFPARTYAVDDQRKTLAQTLTFTRAGTATYFGSDGLLKIAAANEARFDYDPVTLQPRGLLIEGSRTNVLLNSATLVTQSVTTVAQSYTLSFYGTGSVTLSGTATGTLNGSGSATRVTLTVTASAGTLVLTVSGSVTQAQLEVGAFATSYIPTAAAAVTRAADSVVMTGAQFSDWFNASEGTIVAEFTAANGVGTAAQGVFAIGNRSAGFPGSSAIYVGRETSRAMSATSRSAGVTDVALTAANVANAATAKIALAFKANDFAASLNGGAVITDTSAVMPAVNAMSIGDFTGGWQTASNPINGHIRRIRYWPNRLPNALLQEATA